MAFPNSAVSDIIATTIQSRTGQIADNVTANNALLARLKQRGNIKTFSGGNIILEELSFAANGNAGYYSGYETLPVAASDVISAAQFDIKQAACPVTISGLEQLQNAGKEQIIDLLESRMTVAESTMANLIASGIYSDGTGSGGKQITGLKAAVSTSPAAATPYGGITPSAWAFWQNKYLDADTFNGAATTAANIQAVMNAMWASLVRGTDRPDLVVMDNNYWGYYTASLQAIQRFTSSQEATLGFVSMKYMDADVVLDGGIGMSTVGVPSKQMYFLNTKYIKYRPHAQRNMVPLSPGQRYSVNQDAAVQILAWAGNLTCSGRQFQGTVSEVP